jgi:hypothetical protein
VHAACLYRATTISSQNGAAVLARTHASASIPSASLIVTAKAGAGRVVVLADSDLFGDDCLDELDHRELWLNLLHWAAGTGPAAAHDGPPAGAGADALADPAWATLRDETNALAGLQNADGSLAGDAATAQRHVEAIVGAVWALARHFPHQHDYLELAMADLRRWAQEGMGRPDFTASLDAFRPERQRQDGICHLVFFPMYKQNGPRESVFEALVIRVPWPDFVAELERTRYDNPKFVPVELLDATRGYDSECAVLFPETVSVAGRPVNNFGAIFCDREAARLRRVAGAAADLLSLNLPPDAARMLADPGLSQQAYILWDLIHDRAHSHGELPFDPFMIRQRSPYWMYSLEELRCDMTWALPIQARPGAARAAGPRAWPSRATCSTRSCLTACCASPSPDRGCATTTASAASCCSPTCTAMGTSPGPTTSSQSTGPPWATAWRRCAPRSMTSIAPASTARSSPTGARRTTSWLATWRRP